LRLKRRFPRHPLFRALAQRGLGEKSRNPPSSCQPNFGWLNLESANPANVQRVKVVGLYLIRNEVDLIETNLLHRFDTAIDEAIVVDNGSTDGTFERVASQAASTSIRVTREDGPTTSRRESPGWPMPPSRPG